MKETDYQYTSVDLAAFVAKECATKNYYIDTEKLEKLTYCCYGAYLAIKEKSLTADAPFASFNGPKFAYLDKHYLKWLSKYRDVIQELLNHKEDIRKKLDASTLGLLEETVRHFSQMMTQPLTRWTKQKGSPWDLTYREKFKEKDDEDRLIDDVLVRDYFKSIITKKS